MMSKKAPNPVDVHVGSRLRLRRIMLGISQEKLGAELGLTFQQIQKYEKGMNRIGASRLYAISRALDTSIQYFFDDLPADVAAHADSAACAPRKPVAEGADAFLASSEGLQIGIAFSQIKDPSTRRRLSELVRSLAAEG